MSSRGIQRDAGGRCSSCKQFERSCMAHLELFARRPGSLQRSLKVPLHNSFEQLRACGLGGCHLCRCWVNALLAECPSLSSRESLITADGPVWATSPISIISPLRQDIADAREAHYFEICSTVNATMRLGGISRTEFRALTESSTPDTSVAWCIERLNLCHASHMLCSETSVSGYAPTRLLSIRDANTVAVVDGSAVKTARYVALSYCWGGDQETKLFQHNQQLLRDGVDPACLSETIQHAITVCRMLQINYLWVDALCIIQGDGRDWDQEALSIHKVYGGAYVTLSICSADKASDGFLHMKHKALPVDPGRCGILGRDQNMMLPVPVRKTLAHARTETPTSRRGWIFQEELLSPRTIYWTEQGLYWSCCSLKVAQNGASERDELFPHLIVPAIIDAQEFRINPDPLFLWDDMISSFSMRAFTIDDDKLPAVNGLASLIQESTGEAYLYGLWKSRLPSQLLWIVTGALRNDNDASTLVSTGLKEKPPSWSWASVASARQIIMPKQASHRARFNSNTGSHLHLRGRARMLTRDLSPLWSFPEEEYDDVLGSRHPSLKYQPNIWAVDHERNRLLVCLDWRRPISIYLDEGIPDEEAMDQLVCLEISYIGFLLLKPTTSSATEMKLFRRIGCAQMHRESRFFERCEELDVVLE